MKKIIATVLAMVMALALCTTAFAAPVTGYTGYNRGGNKLTADDTNAESFSVEAHEATFNKATGAGNVAYYTVSMLMCDKVTPQYDRQPPLLFRTKGHSIRRVHDFMLYLKY